MTLMPPDFMSSQSASLKSSVMDFITLLINVSTFLLRDAPLATLPIAIIGYVGVVLLIAAYFLGCAKLLPIITQADIFVHSKSPPLSALAALALLPTSFPATAPRSRSVRR